MLASSSDATALHAGVLSVFTRVFLRKPRWVVIDEALDALEDDARQCVISLFKDELKDAAIINISRPRLITTSSHAFCI
jgi:ABC-type uncharacterized transport system fused permease/ATPase subunit